MRYYSTTAGEMTLQSGISSGNTTIAVDTTVGLPASYPYTLILSYGTNSEEVVDVTAASGTTLTVIRGQDGTSAQSHEFGAKVRHGVSARDHRESRQHEAATAAHGVDEVVGTTETQTLEGKTFEPSADTEAVSFKARPGNTEPHSKVFDSSGGVVARWYELALEFISGSTVYARIRQGGGPAVLKNIVELRVSDDINSVTGTVSGSPTGRFIRLLSAAAAELFSVSAAGKVKAAGGEFTAPVTVTGAMTATGAVSGASVSATGAGDFGGDVSGAAASFTGDLDAAAGTFSDDVTAPDGVFTGTSWSGVTVNGGYAAQAGAAPEVRRVGKVVYMRGGWSNTGLTANSNQTIGSIPAGFRPPKDSQFAVFGSSGSALGGGFIATTGDVSLRTGATVASYYMFTVSWLLD